MKLERFEDPMLYHSAQVYEPNIKSPQHNGNTVIDPGYKETNGIFYGLNDYENEADPLPFKLNNGDRLLKIPDLHCYTRGSSLRKESTDDVRDALEDTDFYSDQNVMECGLPEFIVCYKERYTIDVKDICVDEGLPSADTNFVENCKEGKLSFSSSFSRKEDNVDIVLPVSEELEASDKNSGNSYVIKHSDTVNSGSSDYTEKGMKLFVLGDILHRSLREDSQNIATTNEMEDYECPVPGELESSAEYVCCGEDDLGTGELIQNVEVINDLKCDIQRNELKSSVENASGNEDKFDNEYIHNTEAINDVKEDIESAGENISGSDDKLGTADLIQNIEVIADSEDEIERGELHASVENVSDNNYESDTENLVQNSVAIKYVKEEIESVEVESVAEDICGDREESSTEHLIQTGEANKDLKYEVDSDVLEKVGAENGFLQQDSGMENSLSKSSKNNDPVDKLSIQIQSSEKVTANPALDSSKEVSTNSSLVDDLSYNSKVGSASITFHFDPSSPGASGRTETPPESRNSLAHEDDDASDRQKVTSHVQRGDHGESSFATFSGLITYSGPIAYSGSLSHRSDSSATSAHSFAFPILPGEWNSSPVRMAKADRRRIGKHNRDWKKGILCCRF